MVDVNEEISLTFYLFPSIHKSDIWNERNCMNKKALLSEIGQQPPCSSSVISSTRMKTLFLLPKEKKFQKTARKRNPI
jgi:hypothetical protein